MQWLCNADKSSHEPRMRLKYVVALIYLIFHKQKSTSILTCKWKMYFNNVTVSDDSHDFLGLFLDHYIDV